MNLSISDNYNIHSSPNRKTQQRNFASSSSSSSCFPILTESIKNKTESYERKMPHLCHV